MLIAHSMGSIIAWDVLTKFVPHIKIDTLVTIGSPLGIPVVRSKIIKDLKTEQGSTEKLMTPENITCGWYNLADHKDKVAFNYNLWKIYLKNDKGVGPVDLLVENKYIVNGKRNHHKSYGYVQCREMTDLLLNFYKGRKGSGFSLGETHV